MVIIMKEYFIFSIKRDFAKLYKDRPRELFYIFNRIYNMKEIDKEYGYNLFEQISLFFDKKQLNKFITRNYIDKIMYSYNNNEHIVNNLFLNEISILKIRSSNLKIETNHDDSSFLNTLKEYPGNLFICDFNNQNYFFLKKKKEIVKI